MITLYELMNDEERLIDALEKARKVIYKHLKKTLPEDELHVYLFKLGIQALVDLGELDPSYLKRDYEDEKSIDETLKSLDPSVTEVGYNHLFNSLSVAYVHGEPYGLLNYQSDRVASDITKDIQSDMDIFKDFDHEGDTIKTIPLAVLTSDEEEGIEPVVIS